MCYKKLIFKNNGIALVTTLLILFFLLPITITFLYVSTQHQHVTTKEREIKTARSIANNVLVDLMRQLSQNYYENRYESDYLIRAESFYKVGFSTVTMFADSQNHYIFIIAYGKYGKDPNHPLFQKRLFAVIQFLSPWTDFGTMVNASVETSASNVDYYGKFWINDNYKISGSNVRFFGGPIFVNGNLTCTSNPIINADVYYKGSIIGSPTILGSRYNFLPDLTFPTINTTYYSTHYNYKITTNSNIVFNSNGTFTVVGSSTIAIPSTGFIIYAHNCNLTIHGTVRGRVTIVASGTGSNGIITIDDNLVYANGTNQASEQDSLAVVATNKIKFNKPTSGNMTVCGTYQTSGSDNFELRGVSGGTFTLSGCRNKFITLYSISCTSNLVYDPNLNRYPPPGLPEKPYLVTWHIK